MYFWITGLVAVLDQTWRGDVPGIHYRLFLEHQLPGSHILADGGEDDVFQTVTLKVTAGVENSVFSSIRSDRCRPSKRRTNSTSSTAPSLVMKARRTQARIVILTVKLEYASNKPTDVTHILHNLSQLDGL